MSGFKLLAIRPLNGCDDKFLKNLKAGVVYKFYQDYIFTDKKGKEISIINNNLEEKDIDVKLPESTINIYSKENININVCTVVGENGSGKSSLIDFFNTICYFLASNNFKTISQTSDVSFNELKHLLILTIEYLESLNNLLDNQLFINKDDVEKIKKNNIKKNVDEIVGYLQNLFLNYHIKIKPNNENELLKLLLRYSQEGNEIHSLKFNFSRLDTFTIFTELNNKLVNKIKFLEDEFDKGLIFDKNLENNFNFQIFYQKNNEVYYIEKNLDFVTSFDEKFFYSILLNYSIHSLNSNFMGKWIFNLFHKNDGYQTPLVINPYRENGIINVNREIKLSIDRLVFNIIDQLKNNQEAIVLSKYKFSKFILKRKIKDHDKHPFEELDFDIGEESTFFDFIVKNQYVPKFYNDKNILDYSLGYLIKKFRRISSTYMRHFYHLKEQLGGDLLERVEKLQDWQNKKTIKFLTDNKNSHVARKFFQTYNFLKNFKKYQNNFEFIKDWDLDNLIYLSNNEILIWIEYIKENILEKTDEINTEDLLLNLFPNIFEIDIEFIYKNRKIKLSEMSSGEQQYIFNIQTITYHINNLKTIKESKEEDSIIRNYNHVNIILDEIELYYHPQFQKKLVKDIVDSILSLKSLNDMRNFNIIFLTHSPFILSDIPSNNILKLKEGEPCLDNKTKAFGANIHDILANDFFLKKGFMGEFSKNYITNIIEEINGLKKNISEDLFNEYLKKVEIIDEPFIKYKLIENLESLFQRSTNNIDLIIERKEKELEQLKNKRVNDSNL